MTRLRIPAPLAAAAASGLTLLVVALTGLAGLRGDLGAATPAPVPTPNTTAPVVLPVDRDCPAERRDREV